MIEGRYIEGSLSFAAMIPFGGWYATGGKWAYKAIKKADDGVELIFSKIDDLERAGEKVNETFQDTDEMVELSDELLEKEIRNLEGAGVSRGSSNLKKGDLIREKGLAYEEKLTRRLGGNGSFKSGGREFDGAYNDIWYEAKPGNFWDMLVKNDQKASGFKSRLPDARKIATENGKRFQLISENPIPTDWKKWLDRKEIDYIENIKKYGINSHTRLEII